MGDYTTPRRTAVWDLETYRDYFLCMFKNVKTKKPVGFEMYGSQKLDVSSIKDIFREFRIVSFNGNNYDIPMILLAWQGASCMELKEASDRIIQERMRPWEFLKEYGLTMPEWIDHIDLFEPAPSPMVGLKKYGGRMHSKRLQDLPYHHDDLIIEGGSDEKRLTVFNYCINDLDTTIDLYHAIKGDLQLRETLSDKHGIDLRSKSDAQVAEAIIKKEVSRKLGKPIYRDRDKKPGGVFTYKAPDFIEFETNALQDLLWEIEKGAFRVNANTGKVELPQFLADRIITLDATHFKMGIGGLHSMEQRAIHVADEDTILVDFDVTSYYPALILLCNLYPEALGPNFIPVFRAIVEGRVDAKRKMQAIEKELESRGIDLFKLDDDDERKSEYLKLVIMSAGGKIQANGTFGKLGSFWSALFAPKLLIQTTITGQLAILMLIEAAILHGIRIVSANTDGVVFKCTRKQFDKLKLIVRDWEWQTGLGTEETLYSAVYSRDVNNYIAFLPNGKHKSKGAFSKPGLRKDPANWICAQAVIDFLGKGVPVEKTIADATDLRDFVSVRVANGGAEKDGEYLGKTLRWYMSTCCPGPIVYVKDNKTVSRSEGARPCMTLPDGNVIPDDLDRAWYVNEAHAMLDDLGYTGNRPYYTGRSGYVLANLPGLSNVHTVNLETGTAVCGQQPKTRRELWVEHSEVPKGQRECPRCRKWNLFEKTGAYLNVDDDDL